MTICFSSRWVLRKVSVAIHLQINNWPLLTWLGHTWSKGSEHVGLLKIGLSCKCGRVLGLVGLSYPAESSDDVVFGGDFQNLFRRVSRLFSCFLIEKKIVISEIKINFFIKSIFVPYATTSLINRIQLFCTCFVFNINYS